MSKKGFISIVLFIFIPIIFLCLCCAATILFFSAFGSTTEDNIEVKTLEDADTQNEIAVIDIRGVIASEDGVVGPDMVEMIITKLQKAEADDNVKAVILRVDTPGGTVYDSDKIAQQVKHTDEQKPVVALMESSATSGGYYISANTRKIVAASNTITGSIGVVAQVVEMDGLYDKLGVKVITITNTQGTVKAMDKLDDPNSKDYAVLKEVLDDNFDDFVSTVADGRGMSKEQVLKLADGSVYSGTDAKDLGLVDELGGLDKAEEVALDEASIKEAKIILYDTYTSPFSDFRLFISDQINPLARVNKKLSTEPGAHAFYMPE